MTNHRSSLMFLISPIIKFLCFINANKRGIFSAFPICTMFFELCNNFDLSTLCVLTCVSLCVHHLLSFLKVQHVAQNNRLTRRAASPCTCRGSPPTDCTSCIDLTGLELSLSAADALPVKSVHLSLRQPSERSHRMGRHQRKQRYRRRPCALHRATAIAVLFANM